MHIDVKYNAHIDVLTPRTNFSFPSLIGGNSIKFLKCYTYI